MQVDTRSNFQIDIFGNMPVLDAWWRRLENPTRIFTIVLVTWFPLVILSALQGNALQAPRNEAMLWDVAVHMRLLIALPLLLTVSMKSGAHLRQIFLQFINAKILDESDHHKFYREMQETMRLRDSKLAKSILLVIVAFMVAGAIYISYKVNLSSWRMVNQQTTTAGWWYNLISQPILFYTLMYFMYRASLWCRLLHKISRMKLLLKAYHGDDAGGLGFLGHSLEVFILPIFAISSSVAGGMMNLVLHSELNLEGMKFTFAALTFFLFSFFVGPLFLFFMPLKKAKAEGILEYGILSGKQLTFFKRKWLKENISESNDILQDEDFQTIDSNNSVMARVHGMKFIPLTVRDIIPLAVALILPFLPVIALKVPWDVMLKEASKIIM